MSLKRQHADDNDNDKKKSKPKQKKRKRCSEEEYCGFDIDENDHSNEDDIFDDEDDDDEEPIENDVELQSIFIKYRYNSSKVNAAIEKIKEYLIDNPKNANKKLVIFSLWTDMLSILEHRINKELKLSTLKIQGSIERTIRSKILQQFEQIPEKRILLASINCCSLGMTRSATLSPLVI